MHDPGVTPEYAWKGCVREIAAYLDLFQFVSMPIKKGSNDE